MKILWFFLIIPWGCGTPESSLGYEQTLANAYDKGHFLEAQKLFDNLNSFEQKYWYHKGSAIHLELAGMGLFTLMKNLMNLDESLNAGDFLNSLGKTWEFSQEEINSLLEKKEDTEGIWSAVPIFIPKKIEDTPDSPIKKIAKLRHLHQATDLLCPHVSAEKLSQVEGHGYSCLPSDYSFQSELTFALALLGEATIFYRMLLYSENGHSIPGFVERMEILGKEQPSWETISSYLDQMVTMKEDMDRIFDPGPDSLFSKTLANFRLAAAIFSQNSRLPSSLNSGIEKALTSLTPPTITDNSHSSELVFREQMSSSLSSSLSGVIENFTNQFPKNPSEEDTHKLTLMCSTYQGLNPLGALPDICVS